MHEELKNEPNGAGNARNSCEFVPLRLSPLESNMEVWHTGGGWSNQKINSRSVLKARRRGALAPLLPVP